MGFRPQQVLPIMNGDVGFVNKINQQFPSPTGVTYYEIKNIENLRNELKRNRFRPQQGLPIMKLWKGKSRKKN